MRQALVQGSGIDDRDIDELDAELIKIKIKSRTNTSLSSANAVASVGTIHDDQNISVSKAHNMPPNHSSRILESPLQNRSEFYGTRAVLTAANHTVLTVSANECDDIVCDICVQAETLNGDLEVSNVVCCKITHELLKYLIDKQYPLLLQNAGFQMENGILVGRNGCCLDIETLMNLLIQQSSD